MNSFALLTPAEYCAKHKITERTYWRRKAQANSTLQLVYKDGEPYVMDLQEIEQIKTSPEALKMLVNGITADFNSKIFRIATLENEEHKENWQLKRDKAEALKLKKQIVIDARNWNMRGVPVFGYTQRKVYEKIEKVRNNDFAVNPEPLKRAERCDKFVRYYNEHLAKPEVREKIMMLAANFYFENGCGKIRPIAVLVHEYAKKDIEFMEIADIPRTTLLNFLHNKFDSLALKQKHLLLNNYNKFRSRQIYNEGAFTNDIDFMDWWCIDDHVEEISGVQTWNAVAGKFENKKVYTWAIKDAFTLDVIAYAKKADSFKALDIKILLIEALMSRGKPRKGILMDNGLAASRLCADMLTQLGINFDAGPAYEPLHKAVLERSWKFEKEEFNANFKNYIGGKRSEVRHADKKLSPEAPDYTFEEYLAAYDTYINGWYRNKPRTRMIKRKQIEISIKDHFEQCYQNYQCNLIPRRELAFAAKLNKIKKMRHYYINMGNDLGVYDAKAEWMNPVYNEKEYMCVYNPVDTNEIDCYAMQSFIVEETGEQVTKGQYVFSLQSQRAKGSAERQANVAKSRRIYQKQLREMNKAIVNNELTQGIDSLSPKLNEKGKFVDERKELNKYSKNLLEDKIESVSKMVREEIVKKASKPVKVKTIETDSNEDLSAEDIFEKYAD